MKQARSAVLALVMAATTMTMASHGLAQSEGPSQAPAASEAMTDKARELYNEGRALYGQRSWDKAHASFWAAWSLKKHWQIAGMLGHCEVRMERYRDAAEHLAFSIRTGAGSASPEEMKKLQESLDEAKRKVGTIKVQVDTDDAEVRVNGRLVGAAPLLDPLFVEPGEHVLQARTNERSSTQVKVEIGAGGAKEIVLRVDREADAEAPDAGVAAPVAPVAPVDGGVAAEADAGVAEGSSTYPILFVSSTTLFAAGTVLGGVFWSKASGDADDVNELRDSLPADGCTNPTNADKCSRLTESRDSYDSNLSRRNIAFVVGGVGLVAAGVTGYLWMNEENAGGTTVALLPFSDGSTTGISATGSF